MDVSHSGKPVSLQGGVVLGSGLIDGIVLLSHLTAPVSVSVSLPNNAALVIPMAPLIVILRLTTALRGTSSDNEQLVYLKLELRCIIESSIDPNGAE